MGKYDKDRYQKEMAIRYCLARGLVPFLEVEVRSVADLSDTVEVVTDIDVLGVECIADGSLRRTIFDCKTTNRMSPINRAFWAAGVRDYTDCNDAYVLLRGRAVHNHRFTALAIDVDLHDEQSFKDLGRTLDQAFPADNCYQASIARWSSVLDCYEKYRWSEGLFDLCRNIVPLSQAPWGPFRRVIAELRAVRGEFDPAKDEHIAIFFDVLASAFVLWASIGRDIRRFFEPSMDKAAFETVLRYYLWGGKESYLIRQQMRERTSTENGSAIELPAWSSLVSFSGVVISAPQSILECASVCRELSIRASAGPNAEFDKRVSTRLAANSRIRQFTIGLSEYLVSAGALPKDLAKQIQASLSQT